MQGCQGLRPQPKPKALTPEPPNKLLSIFLADAKNMERNDTVIIHNLVSVLDTALVSLVLMVAHIRFGCAY